LQGAEEEVTGGNRQRGHAIRVELVQTSPRTVDPTQGAALTATWLEVAIQIRESDDP